MDDIDIFDKVIELNKPLALKCKSGARSYQLAKALGDEVDFPVYYLEE